MMQRSTRLSEVIPGAVGFILFAAALLKMMYRWQLKVTSSS